MSTTVHAFSKLVVSAVFGAWLLGLSACSSAPVPPVPDTDAGSSVSPTCGEPPDPIYDESPIGWASVADLGLTGTTGGEGGEIVDVATTDDFVAANARVEPLVIRVSGTIGGGARLRIGSHKTILGVGDDATVQGSLQIVEVQNVIVRNLHVVGNNCSDGDEPGNCEGGSDAVRIGEGAHHIWIDHLDIRDGSDGNLDVNGAADYVTISWTKFWYSTTERTHRYSNLIGSGDNNFGDRGKLRVTWHHVWWGSNVQERMPRSRFGQVHVFNSYYSSQRNSYCIRAGVETSILTESNYFDHVSEPFDIENPTGIIESRNDIFAESEVRNVVTGDAFEPPYEYTVDAANTVPCNVALGAGPHVMP